MTNLTKVLREEISRLARKELKQDIARLDSERVALKKSVSQLRKRVEQLERNQNKIKQTVSKVEPKPSEEPPSSRSYISGKGVARMRAQTGLSAADFGQLIGVSAQSVYNMEGKPGKLRLRGTTFEQIMKLKGTGRKAAAKLLEEA